MRHPRESGDPVKRRHLRKRDTPAAGKGIHPRKAAEYWVPVFAGMTAEEAAMRLRTHLARLDKPVKRTVVYRAWRTGRRAKMVQRNRHVKSPHA